VDECKPLIRGSDDVAAYLVLRGKSTAGAYTRPLFSST